MKTSISSFPSGDFPATFGERRIPSGHVKIALENGPFIVDLPIQNGDFQ
jgi:hypothetical protein